MKSGSKLKTVAIAAAVTVAVLAVCFGIIYGTRDSSGDSPEDTAETSQETASEEYQDESGGDSALKDLESLSADEENRTEVVFSENGIEVSGPGASAEGGVLTVSGAGTYILSGSMEGSQIRVSAGGHDEVVLVLSGLNLRNYEEPVIYVENAGQTQLIIADGTVNTLQSGEEISGGVLAEYRDSDSSGGVIYSKDDLSVSGGGSLILYGYINNGIHSTDNLLIDSGNFEITALNNGIKGKDSVVITGGSFRVESGGDGIKSSEESGSVVISGGTFLIEASGDGIQADSLLDISGGTFEIITGGGSGSASYTGSDTWRIFGSGWDRSDETSDSSKGLKSGETLYISGGDFLIDSCDDAVHSDGTAEISGGVLEIATGDDGIHADSFLLISEGTVTISDSYEGLEANKITISGGDISVTSYDDGINANGGSGTGRPGGFFSFGSSSEDMPVLTISGGTITVTADGDGVDSNGSFFMEGGLLIVNGPTSSNNGALDYGSENGGSCTISGGTVLALGASGMADTFSSSSEQCSFLCTLGTFSAGDELTITDSAGKTLFEYTVMKSGNSVVFSSPDLAEGSDYTLTVGSQSVSVSQSSVSVSAGTSGRGNSPTSGFGGMGGMRR